LEAWRSAQDEMPTITMGRSFTGEGVCGSFGGLRQKVWTAKELGG